MAIYVHILSAQLCLDDYIDVNYWKYLKSSSEKRRKRHEKCIVMYATLVQEYIGMGRQV